MLNDWTNVYDVETSTGLNIFLTGLVENQILIKADIEMLTNEEKFTTNLRRPKWHLNMF